MNFFHKHFLHQKQKLSSKSLITETMKSLRRHELSYSWSELPPELLPNIAELLETRTDILHFRRVCKTWRASAPLSLVSSKSILSPLLPYQFTDTYGDFEGGGGGVSKSYTKVLVASSVFLIRPFVDPSTPPWFFTGEELYPGSLCVRRPLSRSNMDCDDFPDEFPYELLDLSKYSVLELGRFYGYNYIENRSVGNHDDVFVWSYKSRPSFPDDNKVVLFVNPNCENPPTINDCVVVELSNEIPLSVKSLKNGEIKKVYFMGKRKFDDIVCFRGRVYAVDRRGRVCAMDFKSLKMSSVTEEPLCGGIGSENKKRFAAFGDDELYLVNRWSNRGKAAFKLFKLNEEEEKWDMVKDLGSDDRMLFVTPDGCCFASAKDFPGWRGNCIVFPWGSFPQYSGKTALDDKIFMSPYEDELPIAVFHFDSGDCELVGEYLEKHDLFWPPPWLWTDECLNTSRVDAEGGEQRGKGKESDEDKVEVEGEEEQEQEDYVQLSKGIRTDQHHITHEENQNNINSTPEVKTPLKIVEQDVSQVKFLGVDVSSHLVPVLQKIWDKYGNIIEGHVVNSESLLTWALESIAKIITILEDNSERSLDDSQAKYINAILLDLQLMHFKLDWVVPFVEKVLTLNKSKGFLELEMTKTKLQTEFHQMEEKSTEQTKLVPRSQMTSTEEPCPTLNLLSLLETH